MRDGASKKFCSRWDLNAGAMRDEQIRRGAPRGGGQTAEAEAEASRGQVPPAQNLSASAWFWASPIRLRV